MSIINAKHEQLNGLFNGLEGPVILASEAENDKVLLTLYVREQLTWFAGHFPEQAVLPGVVQIDWAGKLGRALFVRDKRFTQLTNIKFKSMVMPDTHMDLELVFDEEKGRLKFHFFNASESFSMGSFTFISS